MKVLEFNQSTQSANEKTVKHQRTLISALHTYIIAYYSYLIPRVHQFS